MPRTVAQQYDGVEFRAVAGMNLRHENSLIRVTNGRSRALPSRVCRAQLDSTYAFCASGDPFDLGLP
jgi:hypothetical protein